MAIGSDGTVYGGWSDGKVEAWESATGAPRWTWRAAPYPVSDLVLGTEGILFVGSDAAGVYALDAGTGATRWEAEPYVKVDGLALGAAGALHGTGYDLKRDWRVFARNATTGRKRWETTNEADPDVRYERGSPAVDAEGVLWITDGKLIALDGSSGEPMWEAPADDPSVRMIGAPAFAADGTVYVGAIGFDGLNLRVSGWVFALDSATRRVRWSFALDGVLYGSPTLGPDGTVYVGAANPEACCTWPGVPYRVVAPRKLYALVGTMPPADAPWPMYRHDPRHSGRATWTDPASSGPPRVVWQSRGGPVREGAPLELEVQAMGAPPLSYAWFRDGEAVPGANGSELGVGSATARDAGSYRVVITNPLGAVESADMLVTLVYEVRAQAVGPGSVEGVTAPGTYPPGTRLELSAHSLTGRAFLGWTGDVTSQLNPLRLTVDRHLTLLAQFETRPGELLWKFDVGGAVSSAPTTDAAGRLFFGSRDGHLYAVAQASGLPRWAYQTGGPVQGPAVGSDGTVFAGSEDGALYAVDGGTGALKWRFVAGSKLLSSPALALDGTVFIGADDGKFYAVNGSTGVARWVQATGNTIDSAPAVGTDGTVFFGSADRKMCALDGATGARKWTAEFDIIHAAPALRPDGTVYFGCWDGKLYALDGRTGRGKWEFSLDSSVRATPAVAEDGTIYIPGGEGLMALNGAKGVPARLLPTGAINKSTCPALASDGTAYVTHRSNLYALDTRTGARKWIFTATNSLSSVPVIGPDGTVIVGTAGFSTPGNLYAVRGGAELASGPWPQFGHDYRNTRRLGVPSDEPRIEGIAIADPWVVVSWTGQGILQTTDRLGGTWQDLSEARSPFAVEPANAQRFYRLRRPRRLRQGGGTRREASWWGAAVPPPPRRPQAPQAWRIPKREATPAAGSRLLAAWLLAGWLTTGPSLIAAQPGEKLWEFETACRSLRPT